MIIVIDRAKMAVLTVFRISTNWSKIDDPLCHQWWWDAKGEVFTRCYSVRHNFKPTVSSQVVLIHGEFPDGNNLLFGLKSYLAEKLNGVRAVRRWSQFSCGWVDILFLLCGCSIAIFSLYQACFSAFEALLGTYTPGICVSSSTIKTRPVVLQWNCDIV